MTDAPTSIAPAELLAALKAAGEATRLRILALLHAGEMTVSDLQRVLEQSQPRISRHLRPLTEAGLVRRSREGAWSYYRLSAAALRHLPALARLDPADPELRADRKRLEAVRAEHAEAAAAFFASNAADWDRIRALHAPDETVEAAMLDLVGREPVGSLLDIGTGTGRMLEVFAPLYREALGMDASSEMLGIARAKLRERGMGHARVVRGDLLDPAVAPGPFDLVTMHQVLHFLDRPGEAVREAVRRLAPGGRIVIADFAPHEHEFLDREQAHLRLGFSENAVERWLRAAGAEPLATQRIPAERAEGLTVLLWLARQEADEGGAKGQVSRLHPAPM